MPDRPKLNVSKDGSKYSLSGSPFAIICILCIGLVAGQTYLFLSYQQEANKQLASDLERLERSQSEMNSVRIEQCHSIQEQSLVAMDKISDVITQFTQAKQAQQDALQDMVRALGSLESLVQEQTTQFRILTDRLETKK